MLLPQTIGLWEEAEQTSLLMLTLIRYISRYCLYLCKIRVITGLYFLNFTVNITSNALLDGGFSFQLSHFRLLINWSLWHIISCRQFLLLQRFLAW
jgi:hypothetical protein